MALNLYQLISRVLPGRPFGDGRDGALTVSSNTTQSQTVKSCNGTSGTNTLNLASSGFSNGDVVLIIQMRGTNSGVYEVNLVTSGGGTSTLTMSQQLQTTYDNTGANQAQVIKIPMYTTVTVNSGITWSAPSWNGSTGGLLIFVANVSATITGTISTDGGSASGLTGGTGGGFYGASAHFQSGGGHAGYRGEGTGGVRDVVQDGNNGNGGGPGVVGADSGGGGGGNGAAGTNGNYNVGGHGGYGGNATGSSDLSTMTMGGGGGSGASDDSYGGPGGAGAGIVIAIARSITITGFIKARGGNGAGYTGDPYYSQACGGGGSGGSVLIMCGTGTLGSSLVLATGGAGGSQSFAQSGGAGAVGRIAVHYSADLTGTTSPSFTQTFDGRLVEQLGGILFFV